MIQATNRTVHSRQERQTPRWVQVVTAVLTGFMALTAISGGAAMLTGLDRFPLEWLQGTPFKTYTIPAWLLIFVGGGSLVATFAVFTLGKPGFLAVMVAGALMVGFIVCEVLLLNQPEPRPTPIEIVYLGIGVVTFGLGWYVWLDQARDQGYGR